jgi:dTMP kinase
MRSKKGRLIVIDGSDGSGKATQTARAVVALKEQGESVRTMDFPQYEKNFFGQFIGGCLMGEYGDFLTLDPHITSVLYAADRYESSQIIKNWISDGHTVILDRYVSANQIHQGGKIFDSHKRKEFLLWLDKMEYGVFDLPRPDRVIYLDVPIVTSVGLLQKAREKKNYIKKGKKDLVEQSMYYLENSRKSALWLARHEKNWHRIRCVSGDTMRSIDDIHHEIMKVIS